MLPTKYEGDYLTILINWIAFSHQDIYIPPDRPDLACYGTGYNHWGVQTHQKAFSAWAIIACGKDQFKDQLPFTPEYILQMALKMFRFNLETHLVGSYQCMDGQKWGNTWISALGIERMMHGIEAIENHLTEKDKELLQKVLISECDWLLGNYPVLADTENTSKKNKPESNLWNGALLHRVAMMYPNQKRTEEYKKKGTSFLVNSISVSKDKFDNNLIDGNPISELHIGANFFDSFALNHHGYLNIGYMVICLSNIAMLHFSFKKKGLQAPESLYHHAFDLWKLIKLCTFPDGRLCRIGGDTRARYCYCQDYAIPMWLFISDVYGKDECEEYELGWWKQVKKETDYNGNGSFLGERGKVMQYKSPLYYTRLESDRAVTFSMAIHWQNNFPHKLKSLEYKTISPSEGNWYDSFHGACLHRSKKRLASFVWESAEKPQGLCLPPNRSHMAEWKNNLFPQILGSGLHQSNEIVWHSEFNFSNGFITCGSVITKTKELLAEGPSEEVLAKQNIVFVALPDETSVVCLQYSETITRAFIDSIKGLFLNIPNDIFNDSERTYTTNEKKYLLSGQPHQKEVIDLKSNWVNIDNCLSVTGLYGGNLQINRMTERQISIRNKENGGGFLYADEICCPYINVRKFYDKGTVLVDTGFMLQAGVSSDQTKLFSTNNLCQAIKGNYPLKTKIISIVDFNHEKYILLANFDEVSIKVEIEICDCTEVLNLANSHIIKVKNSKLNITCEPKAPLLLKLI